MRTTRSSLVVDAVELGHEQRTRFDRRRDPRTNDKSEQLTRTPARTDDDDDDDTSGTVRLGGGLLADESDDIRNGHGRVLFSVNGYLLLL